MPKTEETKSGDENSSKITKKDYYATKRRVLGWEKDNYSKLAVIKDTNGYAKMFDHSAIIFVCQVAKRLKISADLASDTDFENATDKPVYIISDFDRLEKELREVGIRRNSVDKAAVVFDLGYSVEPGDLVAMQKESQRLREMANTLVLPNEVFPALRAHLLMLTEDLYHAVHKMDLVARNMVGDSALLIVAKLSENFVEAANGHLDMDLYLKTATKDLRRLNAKLLLMLNIKLIDEKKILRLLRHVEKVQKKVAGAIEKRELDRKKGIMSANH